MRMHRPGASHTLLSPSTMLLSLCISVLLSLLLLSSSSSSSSIFVAAAHGDIGVSVHDLDSSIENIEWADLQNVFILTRGGILYHSNDGGHSFVNQMTNVPDGVHRIASMHVSERDSHQVFFIGSDHLNFHTLDMGSTYIPGEHLEIQDIRMHPTQKDWLLASSMSEGCKQSQEGPSGQECFKILHYTKDFGLTWTAILSYVVQFDWSLPIGDIAAGAHRDSDSRIYVTAHEVTVGSQPFGVWDKQIHFYMSDNFFKDGDKTVLVPHGNRFLFGDHSYLFVAAVDPIEERQVSLKISRDNSSHLVFHTAMLPGNIHLTEHSYTILDTSEGSVFLHVNHLPFSANAYAGHIYTSDWSGLSYSLSLPYNHRNLDGKCDFEKVEGLEGIYLANFIDEEQMQDEEEAEQAGDEGRVSSRSRSAKRGSSSKPKRDRLRTKTVISYDKGGEWSYLVPPTHDSLGKPVACQGECHLHLHGITDAYGPFYSTPTATGLIMGTGVIGAYLQQHPTEVHTYLSRDAGLTWFQVAQGSHIYEFGNHGALIVMAPDNAPTDTILYSFNEGSSWHAYQISEQPFQIENIVIEPEANSHQFLIYGYRDTVGVIVHLDFEALHERECSGHTNPDSADSDYEKWSPSDRRLNGKCLLGRTVTYIRRKRDSLCYIPEAFERPVALDNCPCTAADFECDYGYERKHLDFTPEKAGQQPPCEPMSTQPLHANPFSSDSQCEHGSSTYRITKGYRRVPGNTCYGGHEWDASIAPCPSWLSGSHIGKLVLVVLIIVVIALLVVLIGSNAKQGTQLQSWAQSIRSRFSGAVTKYKLVGAGAAGAHGVEETDGGFYLSEDEFGPSAHLIESHDGAAEKRVNSGIKPLPPSSKAKANVPTLAPPSS